MKFYTVRAYSTDSDTEERYFTNLPAAKRAMIGYKKEHRFFDIQLDRIELVKLPTKELLLAVLNQEAYIRHSDIIAHWESK